MPTWQQHGEVNAIFKKLCFLEKRGHATPCRATGKALGLGQEKESGARGKPGSEP